MERVGEAGADRHTLVEGIAWMYCSRISASLTYNTTVSRSECSVRHDVLVFAGKARLDICLSLFSSVHHIAKGWKNGSAYRSATVTERIGQ